MIEYNMLRHNKHFQEMADKCAKKNGFLCAYYIGRCGDMFVYEPIAKKIERRFEFPDVITIKNNRVKYHKSFTSIDILAGTKRHDHKKGREIYREYERKWSQNDFASEKEREFISEIVENQQPGYDVAVGKEDLYKYLELSERLGMKLKLTPYEWCKERCDGWEYYLEWV